MTSASMRISLELERADNPPLYDELSKFPKGSKRVNRLRTLAHAGLILQQRMPAAPSLCVVENETNGIGGSPTSVPGSAEASLELFSPPID